MEIPHSDLHRKLDCLNVSFPDGDANARCVIYRTDLERYYRASSIIGLTIVTIQRSRSLEEACYQLKEISPVPDCSSAKSLIEKVLALECITMPLAADDPTAKQTRSRELSIRFPLLGMEAERTQMLSSYVATILPCAAIVSLGLLVGSYVSDSSSSRWILQDLWIGSPFGTEILLAILLNLGLMILHEMGHIVTCWACGANVRRVGIRINYIFPSFFSDMSDTWIHCARWQRIWIDLGGVSVDVLFASLIGSFILWKWEILPYMVLASLTLLFSLTCWRIALNLNPLLRFDGYWVLSDALGITHLDRKAWRFVLKRQHSDEHFGRSQLLYTVYAVLSGSYLLLALGMMFRTAWMARNDHSYLAFCIGWLSLVIYPLLRRTFANLPSGRPSRTVAQ